MSAFKFEVHMTKVSL